MLAMDAEIPPHALEQTPPRFDLNRVTTPAYVVDVGLLRQNLEKLALVQREAGCKVLLALKGFSMFSTFGLVKQYLSGCCASGVHEAQLAHEEFGKEVHVYAPAFKAEEMRQIIPIADHISFNSLNQWRTFRPMLDAARARGHAPSPGIRVNPEHSEVEVSLYDPCSPGCRLGTRAEAFENEDLSGLEGLHFHALCEQNSDTLERVVGAVEKRFPKFLEQVKWVNMGGGHHITRNNYDVDRLIKLVQGFKQRWGKDVYLEPGEAVALNTGYLVASVMDIVGQPKRSSVAKSPPTPSIQDHGQGSPHTFRYRAPADSVRAARSLVERLEADERGVDCPDAAQRIHTETESLLAWAKEERCLIEEAVLATCTSDVDQLEGASEHDVFQDRPSGRVIKFTKPPNFGARGAAKSYLVNVLACRQLLGIDWRFEGVVAAKDGVRILTSQAFINGERASDDQIESWFAALGFAKVRENTFQNDEGIGVADARPDNIFRDAKGTLFPFDVHMIGVTLDGLSFDEEPESDTVLPTAILDTSATAHMPDTLEMPYRAHIIGADWPNVLPHTYRLGGMTCLAGDVINDYSFPEPLAIGQKLVFTDMAHYTMVKTTTFNGVPHPDIDIYDPETDELRVVKRFGYEDFKRKLS